MRDGQHVVVVSEGFCGDNGKYATASATRTVTVGASQDAPTPSPTTTHLGVTG